MGLGMNSVGWIHERSTKDMDPGWPSPTDTENGRNICFFQYFSIFFSFVLVFAAADIELTAAARGFRAAASAQGSGDFRRTLKI